MKENAKIREEMKRSGVYQWEVAAQLHISEVTLIRWLRAPLGKEREENVRQAISAAAKAKGAKRYA